MKRARVLHTHTPTDGKMVFNIRKKYRKGTKIPLFGVIKLSYDKKNILEDAYNTSIVYGDNIRTE